MWFLERLGIGQIEGSVAMFTACGSLCSLSGSQGAGMFLAWSFSLKRSEQCRLAGLPVVARVHIQLEIVSLRWGDVSISWGKYPGYVRGTFARLRTFCLCFL